MSFIFSKDKFNRVIFSLKAWNKPSSQTEAQKSCKWLTVSISHHSVEY